jgi:hypothetical protein
MLRDGDFKDTSRTVRKGLSGFLRGKRGLAHVEAVLICYLAAFDDKMFW